MDTMWRTLNNLLCFKTYPELTYYLDTGKILEGVAAPRNTISHIPCRDARLVRPQSQIAQNREISEDSLIEPGFVCT